MIAHSCACSLPINRLRLMNGHVTLLPTKAGVETDTAIRGIHKWGNMEMRVFSADFVTRPKPSFKTEPVEGDYSTRDSKPFGPSLPSSIFGNSNGSFLIRRVWRPDPQIKLRVNQVVSGMSQEAERNYNGSKDCAICGDATVGDQD